MIFFICCSCDTPERGLVEKQFFGGPEVHFSGVAKNVYLGVTADGSTTCLFVLIFASFLDIRYDIHIYA